MSIRPFVIDIHEQRLEDLRTRLSAVRWPKPVSGAKWSDGADLEFLQRLTEYWLNTFDWRAQEKRLNRLPQFMATIDNQEIHFVHVRGNGPDPLPLILTHGCTYSTLLRSVGTEFKVMQELLRHSSLRSTLDVYTQAITPAKQAAQAAVMSLVFSPQAESQTRA